MTGKAIGLGALLLAGTSIASSFVHPWGNVRTVAADGQILQGSTVPEDVRRVFEQKCADCHSNQAHWPLYSHVAPASWLVEHDVHAGRSAMNLSDWAAMRTEDRIAALTRIAAEVRSGEMPPKPYLMLHPANRLTDSDQEQIAAWARAERKRVRVEASAQKETKDK